MRTDSNILPARLLGCLLQCLLMALCFGQTKAVMPPVVPGVVIDHSPAASGKFIGSPSLVILTNGDYLASHDFFGPKSGAADCATTVIFRSMDRGATWHEVAHVHCSLWANLFVHRGAVYLLGVEKEHGQIVIRRSPDGGATWTDPDTTATGLLTSQGRFHTAPVPVVEHAGKLWRAFEDADGGTEWGRRYRAGMLSVPVDADLLNATNWTFSNFLPSNTNWLAGKFSGWLEGNAVLTPEGKIVEVLRVDVSNLPEEAAMLNVSEDGRRIAFNPLTGFVDFPGAAKKFTIRQDPKAQGYWTIATVTTGQAAQPNPKSGLSARPGSIRNTLALLHSDDLRHWERRSILLHHPDVVAHGFQYADWQFDGDDLIAVCRTAFDDESGGAHNYHDANYLTFHRWKIFRAMTMDAAVKGDPH